MKPKLTNKEIRRNFEIAQHNFNIIRWLLLLFFVAIFVIFLILMMVIIVMPKRTCYYEYQTEKIEIGCIRGGIMIPANVERICDEGVSGHAAKETLSYSSIVWYCGDDKPKYCWVKHKVKVCEIK